MFVPTRLHLPQVTTELDGSVLDGRAALSEEVFATCIRKHMLRRWQFCLRTSAELVAMGFTPTMVARLQIDLAHVGLGIGLRLDASQLLEKPLSNVQPGEYEPDEYAWIYRASYDQLITYQYSLYGRMLFKEFVRARIDQLLFPTAYRVGMSAAQLFVAAGP